MAVESRLDPAVSHTTVAQEESVTPTIESTPPSVDEIPPTPQVPAAPELNPEPSASPELATLKGQDPPPLPNNAPEQIDHVQPNPGSGQSLDSKNAVAYHERQLLVERIIELRRKPQ